MNKTIRKDIRMTKEQLDMLLEIKQITGQTMSEIVRSALALYLQKNYKKTLELQEPKVPDHVGASHMANDLD
jgi:hypothetical protein